MIFLRKNISAVFLAVAIFGTMLSMFHYHSEGLECLAHQDEQHITQNELLCPYSGFVAVSDGADKPSLNGYLSHGEIVLADHQPLFLSNQPFVPLLGRAPPFVA